MRKNLEHLLQFKVSSDMLESLRLGAKEKKQRLAEYCRDAMRNYLEREAADRLANTTSEFYVLRWEDEETGRTLFVQRVPRELPKEVTSSKRKKKPRAASNEP